jgi:hypothetical protein
MEIQKRKGYVLYCSNPILIQGIYKKFEDAYNDKQKRIDLKLSMRRNSHIGRYSIFNVEYEVLPDGRIIIEDMVFPSDEFSETEERFEYVLTNSREIE